MNKNIFIPIKEHSARVYRKNFREFCGQPLYLHTVNKYEGLDVTVYIDTDSDEIINTINDKKKLGEFSNIFAFKRKKELIGDDISVNWLIGSFLNSGYIKNEDWIAQIHVTNPFLKSETVLSALSDIEKRCEYDSMASITSHHARFWRHDGYGYCPVNHNPMKLEKTQDLPEFLEENSCFYIFNCNNFLNNGGYRMGTKPLFYDLKFPECLDIDTEEDWNICEGFAKILKL